MIKAARRLFHVNLLAVHYIDAALGSLLYAAAAEVEDNGGLLLLRAEKLGGRDACFGAVFKTKHEVVGQVGKRAALGDIEICAVGGNIGHAGRGHEETHLAFAVAPKGTVVLAVGIGIEQLLQEAALHVGGLRIALVISVIVSALSWGFLRYKRLL